MSIAPCPPTPPAKSSPAMISDRSRGHARPTIGQQLFQGRGIDGLDEVVIEAGFFGAAPVLFLAPTGQGHNEYVLAPGLLADAPAGVVAAEFRHADVEQDKVRLEVLGRTDGVEAIMPQVRVSLPMIDSILLKLAAESRLSSATKMRRLGTAIFLLLAEGCGWARRSASCTVGKVTVNSLP